MKITEQQGAVANHARDVQAVITGYIARHQVQDFANRVRVVQLDNIEMDVEEIVKQKDLVQHEELVNHVKKIITKLVPPGQTV